MCSSSDSCWPRNQKKIVLVYYGVSGHGKGLVDAKLANTS